MSSANDDAPTADPYATIGFALKQAQQALRNRMDSGLREIGLTTPQYAVLAFLEVEAGASNAMLARRAFVTPQTMQAILVALERAGFIARTPHAEHGRVQSTELTASGRGVLEAASAIVADAEARLRNAVAPLDPPAVTAMLLRLAEALR
ncbi:MarR family winged helix-turn-helix transcriptional regulator [Ancylobacter pratisalsi]|uniref:MarR family transcriptional regulator n=1 Tax=Ancylobacter pratisalsi TaxID=1745854 RepID=A0A6P1YJF1_9HYPH|nr:MarR family transcriptional regulator [Ancylobacter pratisalsi]QIB33140.1 MarR family transcriptional regulator [Ancylobacter pratisalsi]